MTTQPPLTEEPITTTEPAAEPPPQRWRIQRAPKAPRPPLRQVLREINWRLVLPVGVVLGAVWIGLLAGSPTFSIFASFLPVLGGLLVGRRVKQHSGWHGLLVGGIAALVATAIWAVLIQVQGPSALLVQLGSLIFLTLFPFTALGVVVSARSEARARATREELQRRGGRLDRPGRVRSLDDLRALSLLQLGGYVADLFRKHGFVVNDYRIEKERDRIEFQVTYENTPWLLRVTTGEKVKPGVAQELAQRMKAEGVAKGVVITSMDFQEPAVRWAKGKPLALIDGPTLLSMDD
jgi:hypothetical protein